MFRKILFILILASAVGGFIYLKPFLNRHVEAPAFTDRLPEAEFLGRCYLLDLAEETSGMMFYNKIPFRDLFAQEFILSQGKNYGLNLQKPLYFFANENGNWGALIEVADSSKIGPGIERLSKLLNLSDSVIYEQKTYLLKEESGYLAFDKNWLFIYKGTQYTKELKQILFAKKGGIAPCWESFFKEKQFKDEKLVIYSNWKKMKKYGLEKALFAHNSDSSSFSLLTYIKNEQPLKISTKKTGVSLKSSIFTKKLLNVHLDISKLRENPSDPIYKLLVTVGRKISFPTVSFLNAWEGDFSFRQGGSIIVKEHYIKSEMDEEFNVIETKTTKDVLVPEFSMMFSANTKGASFIYDLMNKGILRKEENHFRLLTSPPLKIKKNLNNYIFYSGATLPKLEEKSNNHGLWTESGTKLGFTVDSLNLYEVFGSIHIPVNRILRKNKFFN